MGTEAVGLVCKCKLSSAAMATFDGIFWLNVFYTTPPTGDCAVT
jgi:hypothetical protein